MALPLLPTKLPEGKGFYIWQLYRICGGDMQALIDLLVAGRINWVCIKLTDGIGEFKGVGKNFGAYDQAHYMQQLEPLLYAAGIELHGWGYYYGRDANKVAQGAWEARTTVEVFAKYPTLRSWQVNAEKEFKEAGGATFARILMENLFAQFALAGLAPLVGLSSFRFPKSSHPEFPYATFAKWVDFWADQVYWQKDSRVDGGALQLEKSYGQYMEIKQLPYIPAGTTYPEGSWLPTPAQLTRFMEKAQELGLQAVHFWALYYAFMYPQLWDEIAAYDWGVAPDPGNGGEPQPDPELVAALEQLAASIKGIADAIDSMAAKLL